VSVQRDAVQVFFGRRGSQGLSLLTPKSCGRTRWLEACAEYDALLALLHPTPKDTP
jgi:hypothetical protein